MRQWQFTAELSFFNTLRLAIACLHVMYSTAHRPALQPSRLPGATRHTFEACFASFPHSMYLFWGF